MSRIIKLPLVLILLAVFYSCSDDNDSTEEIITGNVINYQNPPNSEGQLLSEIYVDNDNATTYLFGDIGLNGAVPLVKSLVYKINDSNTVEYLILDENQRVKYIYSEVNGVKQNEVHSFTYPQIGLVNHFILERNWDTLEDIIIKFSTVEVDEDSYVSNSILGRNGAYRGIDWGVLGNNLGVVVGVVGAAITIYLAPTVLLGVLAAVVFAGAATAAEVTEVNIPNENAPTAPVNELIDNQCSNSSLEVIIGVDPGNVIVAIVNGDSVDYDFFWSTGATNTALISDVITAPGSGNYYVIVVDDYGCVAFASVTIGDINGTYSLAAERPFCYYNYSGGGGASSFHDRIIELKDNREINLPEFGSNLISASYDYPTNGQLVISISYFTGGFSGSLGSYCRIELMELIVPYNLASKSLVLEGATVTFTEGLSANPPCGGIIEIIDAICPGEVIEFVQAN